MNDSFYIGATGLRTQQAALDIVSNNLANLNTTAYKRSTVVFGELIAPRADAPAATAGQSSASATLPGEVGLGVNLLNTPKLLTPGDYKKTDGQFDVAVRGAGFIELASTNHETMLWRGGTLSVTKDGLLVGPGGVALKGVSALPRGTQSVQIDEQGRVLASVAGQASARLVGQLDLVTVTSPSMLQAASDGIYKVNESLADVTRARPGERGLGTIAQGYLEGSNVNISEEMISLLWIQRSYGANAKVIQAADELMSMTNGLKR